MTAPRVPRRLADAGDEAPAWITLLTTEHYNLQTARASTIGEANGRASIFLGSVSAGLIALGFQGASGGGGAATTTFRVVVLTSLAFLGIVTLMRCLELSIDDRRFAVRIDSLRAVYAELVPGLADALRAAAGEEEMMVMLPTRRKGFQLLLSVAGTVGLIAGIVAGADAGVLAYGLSGSLGIAIAAGMAAGVLAVAVGIRFQRARWLGAGFGPPSAATALDARPSQHQPPS